MLLQVCPPRVGKLKCPHILKATTRDRPLEYSNKLSPADHVPEVRRHEHFLGTTRDRDRCAQDYLLCRLWCIDFLHWRPQTHSQNTKT